MNEPVYLQIHQPCSYVMSSKHKRLARIEVKDHEFSKRIVECINAMAGIHSPEDFMGAMLNILQDDRDPAELVELALRLYPKHMKGKS